MRFKEYSVSQDGNSRTCSYIFAAAEFTTQTSHRHECQIAPRFRHHGRAGRAENDQALTQIRRFTDVCTSQHEVQVPEKSREISVPPAVKMIGYPV